MNDATATMRDWLVPTMAGVSAAILLLVWFSRGTSQPLAMRVPGTDHAPGAELGSNVNAVLLGKLIPGPGKPTAIQGSWSQFRGTNFDNINREPIRLARSWQPGAPRALWALDVGEGYAGTAVLDGRVYLMDYDRDKRQDALRCLSLESGQEIWRFSYPVPIKRNHGMSRTTPVVTAQHVVAIGPKCHVVCLDRVTGELKWGIDMVREHGTTVPPWYAGQCPFVENGLVILAPGGPEALVVAVDIATGKAVWTTPNPHGWNMTHASITPVDFDGERMYVYCADKGVVGVSAKDGRLLWETTDWKISIATVPSPVSVGSGRIFLSGGYNAGSAMLQLKRVGGRVAAETAFRLPANVFGATQHTPIFHDNHIYGVRPDGKFACLTLEGKVVWTSDSGQQFGLGPFIMAEELIYALNDSGLLRLIEATPSKYNLLAQSQILEGHEAWGPLSIAGGRLLARDLTRLVCVAVAE